MWLRSSTGILVVGGLRGSCLLGGLIETPPFQHLSTILPWCIGSFRGERWPYLRHASLSGSWTKKIFWNISIGLRRWAIPSGVHYSHFVLTGKNVHFSRHNVGLIQGPPKKPLNTIVLWCPGGFRWAPMMPRDASLSDSYTSDRRCFPSAARLEYYCWDVWRVRCANCMWRNEIEFSL